MSASSSPTYVLGLSFGFHDAAAALLRDGVLVAAAQEERFSRKKQDPGFPHGAVAYCLAEAGIAPQDLSRVVYYEKPLLKFERVLFGFLRSWPRQARAFFDAVPTWTKEKFWVAPTIRRALGHAVPVSFCEHHVSHAASAFFASPFARAAVLTVDGIGEWATASFGRGEGARIGLSREIRFPHSLGLFYGAVTRFLGFEPNADEYKVMGLAPYGTPRYAEALRSLFDVRADGSFGLVPGAFGETYAAADTDRALERAFRFPRRKPERPLAQEHKDAAASLQALTNEAMVGAARRVRRETGETALCLAGGVALNCVANTEVFHQAGFTDVWVQPAAGDAGGALGAALWYWHQVLGNPRGAAMDHVQYGPAFSNQDIRRVLDAHGATYEALESGEMAERVADLVARQAVVGWFQGRMEWGPRALGNRSILADPRNKENWQRVNVKIKFRESFRPFAPAVLTERFRDWFDGPANPFMLFTARVKEPDKLPAVTHVDGSARVQTVDRNVLPAFAELLDAFERKTGVPVLINTSFNVRGEPIVCTPEDAWDTFQKTEMDALAIGGFLVRKQGI